jgi:hypothetical protein
VYVLDKSACKIGRMAEIGNLVMVGLLQQPFPMEEIQRPFRMEAFCIQKVSAFLQNSKFIRSM